MTFANVDGVCQCDGQRPTCGTCINKGTQCIYHAEPGQTRTAALKQRNAALERDLAYTMEILSKICNSPPEEAFEYVGRLRSGQEPLPTISQVNIRNESPARSVSSVDQKRSSAEAGPFVATGSPITYELPYEWIECSDTSRIAIPSSDLIERATNAFSQAVVTDVHSSIYNNVEQLLIDIPQGLNLYSEHALLQICACCAVGTQFTPDLAGTEVGDAFYRAAKTMLDEIIEDFPLIAMKACNLLAIYAINSNRTMTALGLLDLGVSLGRSLNLHTNQSPTALPTTVWTEQHKLFQSICCSRTWVSESLGYPSHFEQRDTNNIDLEDRVQLQVAEIVLLKIEILKTFPDDHLLTASAMETYRAALRKWEAALPVGMNLESLLKEEHITHPRRLIYLVHLVYMSASTLLHRRLVLHHTARIRDTPNALPQTDYVNSAAGQHFHRVATDASREGTLRAQQMIRLIHLLMTEGNGFPSFGFSIYCTYLSCAILLHVALLKSVRSDHPTEAANDDDLHLISKGLGILEHCSRIDGLCHQLQAVIKHYFDIILRSRENKATSPSIIHPSFQSAAKATDFSLQRSQSRDAVLQEAERDLARIICWPLGSIATFPFTAPSNSTVRMLGIEEVSWGLHLESIYEDGLPPPPDRRISQYTCVPHQPPTYISTLPANGPPHPTLDLFKDLHLGGSIH